jgi:hypothetical protein
MFSFSSGKGTKGKATKYKNLISSGKLLMREFSGIYSLHQKVLLFTILFALCFMLFNVTIGQEIGNKS